MVRSRYLLPRGEIDLSKLPTGSYVVTELECPGYVVDGAQRIIHLRANDIAEFVFTNTKWVSSLPMDRPSR